ncbi:MAG: hypothetical protein WBN02_17620 [Sedimenticolaceae bacterium]
MIHTKQEPTPTGSLADTDSPDEHHGDLRKGAYLKRRADYQMQASSPNAPQAGYIRPPGRKAR